MPSANLDAITNHLLISEAIGTAGQPTATQFADIGAAGYDLVVNLAMPDSTNALPNERELVEEQGMDYVHIPVEWESPTLHDLDQFFEVMRRHADKKVFVHCVLNMRVSCFMLLHRVLRQGVPLATARATLLEIWQPNPVWEAFLQRALDQPAMLSSQR
jgi:protein tyrosine phosphatase (PTP) superfamily phosphohydrolase (DUF442 family)